MLRSITEEYDYKKLYENIMAIDPKIRFGTIVDYDGTQKIGGQREGVTSYLDPYLQKETVIHAIRVWQLQANFSSSIGMRKYAFAEYEKIKRVTIPLGQNHLIYLTLEPNMDHRYVINKVLGIIQEIGENFKSDKTV